MTDIFKSADWAREAEREVSGKAVVAGVGPTIADVLKADVHAAVLKGLAGAPITLEYFMPVAPLADSITDAVMEALKGSRRPAFVESLERRVRALEAIRSGRRPAEVIGAVVIGW